MAAAIANNVMHCVVCIGKISHFVVVNTIAITDSHSHRCLAM